MKTVFYLLSGLLFVSAFNLIQSQVSLKTSPMVLMAGADNEGVSIRGGRGKGGKAYEDVNQGDETPGKTMAEGKEINKSGDTLGRVERA